MPTPKAIIITGPVGVGKTSTMSALTDMLQDRGIPCAGIDMDSLRWFYPHPPGDRFGASIGRRHLEMITASYHELGIPLIVLADVVESPEDRAALAAAMPQYELHIVRLRVPMHLIHERLKDRESEDRLHWYLQRAPELEAVLDAATIGDTIINVDERSQAEVAFEIADHLQLIGGGNHRL